MIISAVVGVLVPRGVRIALGCDGSPEVTRVGAGSTGRSVLDRRDEEPEGSTGSDSWRGGQAGQCCKGGQRERGERRDGGQMQCPAPGSVEARN